MGINVFVVLLIGIVSGSVIMLATGATQATDLLANMGNGAAGMYETTMVAILVSAICALIQEYDGFTALLSFIRRFSKVRRAASWAWGFGRRHGCGHGKQYRRHCHGKPHCKRNG